MKSKTILEHRGILVLLFKRHLIFFQFDNVNFLHINIIDHTILTILDLLRKTKFRSVLLLVVQFFCMKTVAYTQIVLFGRLLVAEIYYRSTYI